MRLAEDLDQSTLDRLASRGGKKDKQEAESEPSDAAATSDGAGDSSGPVEIILRWRKFVFDPDRKLVQ